jgi:hypothetical protein
MFGRINRNFNRSSMAFPEAINLGNLIGRWLPFAARRSASGALQHIATLPLTPHSCVALIRVHDEDLVLGVTSQSVTLLTKAGPEKSAARSPGQSVDAAAQENCGCAPQTPATPTNATGGAVP